MKQQGDHHDEEKLRFDLLPPRPIEDIVGIFTYGTTKYGDRNWEKGIKWLRVFGSVMRHLWAWFRGEDIDPESGQSHLAHAATDIIFLQQYAHTHPELDDREKP